MPTSTSVILHSHAVGQISCHVHKCNWTHIRQTNAAGKIQHTYSIGPTSRTVMQLKVGRAPIQLDTPRTHTHSAGRIYYTPHTKTVEHIPYHTHKYSWTRLLSRTHIAEHISYTPPPHTHTYSWLETLSHTQIQFNASIIRHPNTTGYISYQILTYSWLDIFLPHTNTI